MKCFECGSSNKIHDHHVVPKSLGGTKTVGLCEKCHGKVHDRIFNTTYLTTQALSKKRKNNERISTYIPYGYKLNNDKKHLDEDDEQQAIIKKIIKWREDYTLQEIADKLKIMGCKTALGGKWFPSTVSYIIERNEKLGEKIS